MPAAYDDITTNPEMDGVDSDQDAEGEEDTDPYRMDQQLQDAVHKADSGEQVDEEAFAEPGVSEEDAGNREVQNGDGEEIKLNEVYVDKDAVGVLEPNGN